MINYKDKMPALALLLISPLIAEFLLGDFNIRQLAYMGIFVPLYGGGALLIREVTRHSGRGWLTMLLLALAYALILEGFVNQTMINPNYMGQHMLKYGFIPSLGTSFNYDIFILTLHVVWSISSPIALAEALAGNRAQTSWLNKMGVGIVAILTLLGVVGTTIGAYKANHFIGSPVQFMVILALIIALLVTAFKFVPKPSAPIKSTLSVTPWFIFVVVFVLSSMFQLWFNLAPKSVDPLAGAIVFLLIDISAVSLFVFYSKKMQSTAELALLGAMGAILTYSWFGMRRFIDGASAMGVPTEPIDIIGQACLSILFMSLGWIAYKKLKQGESFS